MTEAAPTLVAVVATYRPSAELLTNLLTVADQCAGVIVVDDGSGHDGAEVLDAAEAAGAVVLRRASNTGIAATLNAGIIEARARFGADAILTLDQDSSLTPGYVAAALATWRQAEAAGVRVGLVAAQSYGPHRAPTRRSPDAFARAFDPMQSGCVVPVATYDAVGLLDESLFIDGVDSEFTVRVASAGLAVLIGEGCVLHHGLGRRERTTWFGRPVTIAGHELSYNHHAPWRVYYIVRNGTAITRRYVRRDPGWVARRLVEEGKAHAMRLVLGRERGKTLRALGAGFLDAARGRSGKIPDAVAARLR